MPAIAIIIPNKNRSRELAETLASVRAQTFGDFECVVVDDNSTDDFATVVAPYAADPRFRFITQSSDRSGAPAARNDGVRLTSAPLLIFLDSDDLIAPHCLQQRLCVMRENPTLDFAVFPAEMFRAQPGDVGMLWNADTEEDDLDRFCRHDVPWQTTGPIWRRTALVKIGDWDEAAKSAQDWEFHIRALLCGLRYARFSHLPVDLYWRMASAERNSIGKSAVVDKSYHPARLALFRRIRARMHDAGALTELRRRCFAGMYFTACEQIGLNISGVDARAGWKTARVDRLIDWRTWFQGWFAFIHLRSRKRYRKLRARITSRWPAEYLLPRSATFMKTPSRQAVSRSVSEPIAEVA